MSRPHFTLIISRRDLSEDTGDRKRRQAAGKD
jgi:hypothetical protein